MTGVDRETGTDPLARPVSTWKAMGPTIEKSHRGSITRLNGIRELQVGSPTLVAWVWLVHVRVSSGLTSVGAPTAFRLVRCCLVRVILSISRLPFVIEQRIQTRQPSAGQRGSADVGPSWFLEKGR